MDFKVVGPRGCIVEGEYQSGASRYEGGRAVLSRGVQEPPLRGAEPGRVEDKEVDAVVQRDKLNDVARSDGGLARNDPNLAFGACQVDAVDRDFVVDPELGP